jgi:dolichyl-phosphate beta-glucosyltransferase
MYLSIIIPAYNEEKRLPATLLDIEACMKDFQESYEIIVVSDGSRDNTASVARELSARVRNVRVIENKENHGKGWVTKQGLLEAEGEWRLFMDADNSTTMREFKKLQPFTREGYGVIIGSRGIRGAELHPPQPLFRRIPGKIGNLIIQFLALPGIWDTQCGFKCFSQDATKRIFPLMRVGKWGFDVEALALARKFGFRIKEVPILWRNDERSTLGAGAYISTLLEVAKIRWWLTTGVYDKK